MENIKNQWHYYKHSKMSACPLGPMVAYLEDIGANHTLGFGRHVLMYPNHFLKFNLMSRIALHTCQAMTHKITCINIISQIMNIPIFIRECHD